MAIWPADTHQVTVLLCVNIYKPSLYLAVYLSIPGQAIALPHNIFVPAHAYMHYLINNCGVAASAVPDPALKSLHSTKGAKMKMTQRFGISKRDLKVMTYTKNDGDLD